MSDVSTLALVGTLMALWGGMCVTTHLGAVQEPGLLDGSRGLCFACWILDLVCWLGAQTRFRQLVGNGLLGIGGRGSRFACWWMDLVCWSGARARFCQLVGTSGFEDHLRSGGSCSGVAKPSFCGRYLSIFVILALACRVGEAAVPGPSSSNVPSWSLGVCNPSGLLHKGHLLCNQVDVWAVSETHLSLAAYRRFRNELRSHGSDFQWCVPGVHVPCRSTVSDVGAWSGVAVISQWPTRSLPADWNYALAASGRLVCTTTYLHGLWVSGVTMYGTPCGPTHPNAKATTNALLTAAVARIGQSHGPRYVCSDWNHDLDTLEAYDLLTSLGFVEVQTLHFDKTGVHPQPTCKLKTQRDFLFLSPELQNIFDTCSVHHDMWPDHSPVVAHFRGGQREMIRTPWPIPFAIPWDQLKDREEGLFVDFAYPHDPTAQYGKLWQDVEQKAQTRAKKHGRPLPLSSLGRGQRTSPAVVSAVAPPVVIGRKGDLQPNYYGSSWQHAHMFRQVRRLQSYVRLVQVLVPGVTHTEHRASLWRAICLAPGFPPSFSEWWSDRSSHSLVRILPIDPPAYDVAVEIFAFVETATRNFEKHLNRHRAYHTKLRRGHDMRQVYAAVKKDPPIPVETLIQSNKAIVRQIDHDDVAVELEAETPWFPDQPILHQGRTLDTIYVTEDKLWLSSIEGIEPGHVLVQSRGLGKLSEIFAAFVEQWSQRWCRHDLVPDSQWSSIVDFASRVLRPIHAPEVVWNRDVVQALFRSKRKVTSCGVDGVTRMDLLALQAPHLDSVLSLYQRVEHDGMWPQQVLIGAVRSLAKCESPGGVNDFRPVTILGLLYRVWGSAHARHWIRHLDSILDPHMYGSRIGCQAAHVWRYVLDQVEWSHVTGAPLAGVILDLTKAFNTIPRYPTFAVAKLLGIHSSTLHGWAGALGQLERRFVVRGSYSPPVRSTCGMPEGCALSCLGMILLNQIFHTWMAAGSTRCVPISYVDNWELVLNDPSHAVEALARAEEFTRAWDLTLDRQKTCAWGTDRDTRSHLRRNGFVVVSDVKDLGAHLVFSKQLRNHTVLSRISQLDDFWAKLYGARGTLVQKLRAIKTAAWPRALHGISAVQLGLKHFGGLRSSYMKSLRFAKPGANPMLQLLLDGFAMDPQLYAIWRTVLDFRALGSDANQLSTLDLIGSGVASAQATVSEVLCHRLHQLGWTLATQGHIVDRFGKLNLATGNLVEVQLRISWAWLQVVAHSVSSRLDFHFFASVHVEATRCGIRKFPLADQCALRAVMNGTTFTNRHAYHWSDNGSCACPECGMDDDLHHKYWQCPFVQDLVESVSPDVRQVVEELPSCMVDRGWTCRPKIWNAWIQALVDLPMDFAFSPVAVPTEGELDLFTDGSCFWGENQDFRVAAWAVCVGNRFEVASDSPSFSIVTSSHLPGLVQTAYRAELAAVYAALCFAKSQGRSCRVWSDCEAVVKKFRKLTQGHGRLGPNSLHSDLWMLILEEQQRLPQLEVVVAKVSAHVSLHETETQVDHWLAIGNSTVDAVAKSTNADRAPSFWRLWSQVAVESQKAEYLADAVRQHMVQVNRRWYERSQGVAQPEVPVTRQAKELTRWFHDNGPVQVVNPRFRKLFGLDIQGRMVHWWNSLLDHGSEELHWVSYTQLYIDWQLTERHPGVLKLRGVWHDGGAIGAAPEQYSFRCRSKWFRLLTQQWSRDVGSTFARGTTRPFSPWLSCHVGCASLPVRKSRLEAVDHWLAKTLAGPVLGLGAALDQLPPAW